jgi:hypothetical protein
MKPRRWLFLILITVWFAGTGVSLVSAADLYQGRVVDEETGQPLAGAVVTVVWYRSAIIAMEGGRDFQSAQETLADSNGKFSLIVSPGVDWNPFSYIRKDPEIVIYQPGYEPTWAGWRVRNGFADDKFPEALKKGATIKLPKLKTTEEQKKFAGLPLEVSPGAPRESIPHLLRVVNIQRKMVGYPIYPEALQGGKKP